jgi:DNA-binding transcriptional ArsR family regulator
MGVGGLTTQLGSLPSLIAATADSGGPLRSQSQARKFLLTGAQRSIILNHMVNYPRAASAELLDATFGALADPTRRAILARLAQSEATVTELAAPFDVSLPAVSKHLRVLESAGLLRREIDGRIHRCRLAPQNMKDAGAWIETYRVFWEAQFDALAQYLESTPTAGSVPIQAPRHLSDNKSGKSKRDTTEENAKWPHRKAVPTSRSKSAAPSRPRVKKSSPRGPSKNN